MFYVKILLCYFLREPIYLTISAISVSFVVEAKDNLFSASMADPDVDFTNPEEVNEFLTNTEIEYMYGCHKENDPDSK